MKNKYEKTIFACFGGYVVQAIVNGFVPLLFVTFQSQYDVPLDQITLLITVNFVLQLSTDLAATFLVDKLGYRFCVLFAHACAALGLVCLTILPELFASPFVGLMISVIIYAVGGGLIEVVISPIVDACPSERKDKTMSLLHSFYSWGSVAVVALSALFFELAGINNWKIISLVWAAFPLVNGILFAFAPMPSIYGESGEHMGLGKLLKNKTFWLFFAVMVCAGACELAISQWASTFVENTLELPKAVGDLLGPALFAVTMGLSRLVYGKSGDKLNLDNAMLMSGICCTVAYLMIALAPVPAVALIGMALCGFGVGITWPGTYSAASARLPGGGSAMFALLALGGDLGCVSGPAVVGWVTDSLGGDMKMGLLCATAFPLALTLLLLFGKKRQKKTPKATAEE